MDSDSGGNMFFFLNIASLFLLGVGVGVLDQLECCRTSQLFNPKHTFFHISSDQPWLFAACIGDYIIFIIWGFLSTTWYKGKVVGGFFTLLMSSFQNWDGFLLGYPCLQCFSSWLGPGSKRRSHQMTPTRYNDISILLWR